MITKLNNNIIGKENLVTIKAVKATRIQIQIQMSFKREGTDTSLLQDLQRRRISELLVGHIPEDEALLLKNGKYACTLCQHRPVLDTIEMLANHRKGKRHLTSLTRHLAHLKWREKELQRRTQAATTLVDPEGTEEVPTSSKVLGSAAAKGSKRAPRLKLMKSAPYNSCCKKKSERASSGEGTGTAAAVPSKVENPLIKAYLKDSRRKRDFLGVVERTKRNPGQRANKSSSLHDTCDAAKDFVDTTKHAASRAKPTPKPESTAPSEEETKQREKANYFLNLRMSGWKLNPDGKWVKDENVEFDSDEDEPPEFKG
ncbi:sodium channel modifier 1 [Ixodes scapularis]|nr:sodium channel modifier 1 [Ixodes scapularis]